jgi:IS30 family transposase
MAKRVTEKEKEKMWQLYQKHGSFTKVAKLTKRDRSTVARYVSEYEAVIRSIGHIRNSK